MTLVRLFVSDPRGPWQCVRYRFPVRIGRHECNDCQMQNRGVSRFHLELDWADSRLQLRDLGSRNGVLVRVAGEMRRLRGSELTTASREVEFAVAGIWMRALVEEWTAPHAAVAVQDAIEGLLQTFMCSAVRDDSVLAVLSSLERSMVLVRGILQSDESARNGTTEDEVIAALRRWTQASIVAVTHVRSVLEDEANDDA
jgi:hypothetical protein